MHKYAPRAGQSIIIPVGSPEESTTSYRMNTGSFAGSDPRDLVRKAIEWWDEYLREIEASGG